MNKLMFWSGFTILAFQFSIIMAYMLYTLDWTFLPKITSDLIVTVSAVTVVAILNIFAVILMAIGLIKDE